MTLCDACRRPATWAASISRITKTKKKALPARLLLCDEHAANVMGGDPYAKLKLLPKEQT